MISHKTYKSPPKPQPALLQAQELLFWDETDNPPALDSPRLLLRIMEMGTWEMIRAMEKTFPQAYLKKALQQATFGALSPKSWHFWCLRLQTKLPYPDRFASTV